MFHIAKLLGHFQHADGTLVLYLHASLRTLQPSEFLH